MNYHEATALLIKVDIFLSIGCLPLLTSGQVGAGLKTNHMVTNQHLLVAF